MSYIYKDLMKSEIPRSINKTFHHELPPTHCQGRTALRNVGFRTAALLLLLHKRSANETHLSEVLY